MPIQSIRVTAACDVCGITFSVAIDEADVLPQGWSIYDVAVDAVRGGVEYRDCRAEHLCRGVASSVQQGLLLCRECTVDADAAAEQQAAGQ